MSVIMFFLVRWIWGFWSDSSRIIQAAGIVVSISIGVGCYLVGTRLTSNPEMLILTRIFFKTKMTRMEKICLYLAMGGAVILLFMFFFSTRGVVDYARFKSRQEKLEAQAAIAESQNSKLEKEIHKLKTDIEYIKHLAKHEHEMAAQDELVFKEKPPN
ncbi:septum formation initiator family protein [Desulfobacter postgatei]|nr:septum formation initiator family protein [uncultured Desulfobacter sp.]